MTRGQFWDQTLKKLTALVFLKILGLETYLPCCKKAKVALRKGPYGEELRPPTALPDESMQQLHSQVNKPAVAKKILQTQASCSSGTHTKPSQHCSFVNKIND